MNTTRKAAVGLTAVAALLLSGCAPGEAEGPGGGDTVKVMVFGTFSQPPFPLAQIKTAAEAAVAAVNQDGGIDGVTIELESCDDQMSANGATACARQAVQDGVVAVVGAFTVFGDAIVPLLEAADIPYIGGNAISQLESTSEISFPVATTGTPIFAVAASLKRQGCDAVVIAATESAEAQASQDLYGTPISEAMDIPIQLVQYPANTTDYSSVAARIAAISHCVFYAGGPQDTAALITALHQTGEDFINVALSTTALPESSLQQFGAVADGIQVVSPYLYPSSGAEAATTAEENMKAVDPSVVIDDAALNSYNAVLILAQAAAALDGDITGPALIDVLNAPGTTIDTGLFTATDFAADRGFFPPIPRAAGSTYYAYEAQDGVYVPVGDPIELAGIFD